MFNLRVKYFVDGSVQLRHFTSPVHDASVDFSPYSGEIYEKKSSDTVLIENPFNDDALERVKDLSDKVKRDYSFDNYLRSKNLIYDYARSNLWDWFFTFTFDGSKVDRFDYVTCSKKLSVWLNNVKKRYCSDMVYLVVPEQHENGAWHFHGLFSNCDGLNMIPSGHYDKSGRMIYNIGRYKWGFTTATKVGDSSKASAYLCKYVTKSLCDVTKGRHRYWVSSNAKKPMVEDYMIDCNLMEFLKSSDVEYKHLKRTETPYGYVTYVEL